MPTCPVCKKEFIQLHHAGQPRKYCSEQCHYNASLKPKEQYTPCLQCGKLTNVKFCSSICSRLWWKEHPEAKKRYELKCLGCGKTYYNPDINHQYCTLKCAKSDQPLTTKNCELCGRQYRVTISHSYQSRYCSASCNDKIWAKFHRDQIRQKNCRYIARKLSQFIENVSLNYIYKRDNGICGICGKKVNKDLYYPHLLSPSLDHIKPLSLGGLHENKNCQLAHLRCNCSKRNNLQVNKQILLIG